MKAHSYCLTIVMMNRKKSKDLIAYGEYYQTLKTYYGGIYLHITLLEISALSSFTNIFVSINFYRYTKYGHFLILVLSLHYISQYTKLRSKIHIFECFLCHLYLCLYLCLYRCLYLCLYLCHLHIFYCFYVTSVVSSCLESGWSPISAISIVSGLSISDFLQQIHFFKILRLIVLICLRR